MTTPLPPDLLADELDAAYRRRTRRILEWIAAAPGGAVLDAGCGRAFTLSHLRAASPVRAVGCDRRLDHLAIGRRALAEDPGVRLVAADLARLPFTPGSFDAVIASEVLEHVADDRAVLRGLADLLRPGGLVAITVPNARYPLWYDPLNRVLEKVGVTPIRRGPLAGIWPDHRRLYTAESLRSLVTDSGLEAVDEAACTRHGIPFLHTLVYAIGRPLYERGLLPRAVARAGDRHRTDRRARRSFDPLAPARWLVRRADRSNLDREPPGVPTVNLCLLAQRAEAD